jgi:nucleoside diphosphate kinase
VFAALASAFSLQPSALFAQTPTPGQLAEQIRSDLTRAQLALSDDAAEAGRLLAEAEGRYSSALALAMAPLAPAADESARKGFADAAAAVAAGDGPGFAAARARVWTALLAGGYAATENAIRAGDGQLAASWLPLREFRHATRFSRPDADATLAVSELATGKGSADAALAALRADLLDTYQARLTEALNDAVAAEGQGFGVRRAEAAGLRVIGAKLMHLSPADAARFYVVHKERPFYGDLTRFMSEGPIFVVGFEGSGAVAKWRDLMGPTDSKKAPAGTIRHDFGTDVERNAVHGSDAADTARWELGFFFSERELVA